MIADLRREFNERLYSPEKYARLQAELDRASGTHVPFRHSETPVFLPRALVARMVDAGAAMMKQATSPEYRQQSDRAIPAKYAVPNEAPQPLFVQADFGLVRTATGIEPRLVEIQGFPSLYGYQELLSRTYRDVYGIDPTLIRFPPGTDEDLYAEDVRRAIVGDHDPEHVVLLEIHPERQKTLCDFRLTERLTGIRTVCLTKVRAKANKLMSEIDGREVPIERIYNRCIVDELDRLGVEAPFDWNAHLDVEWAGHPNWYFRLSKFTIPFLDHSFVPETHFVDKLARIPDDLDEWVLKPLFSFAGLGVSVGPSREEIERIADPENWILQRRMRWEPVIDTPHGPTQIEIRVMYIWPESQEPQAVNLIIRSGRGKMMGVDFNKGLEWVGASAAFIR
jgi:hypothetical protein